MAHAEHTSDKYYVPHGSHWPITGSIGLFGIMVGASMWLNGSGVGPLTFSVGFAVLLFMIFGWFGQVIRESESGTYNDAVGTSFRMGQ